MDFFPPLKKATKNPPKSANIVSDFGRKLPLSTPGLSLAVNLFPVGTKQMLNQYRVGMIRAGVLLDHTVASLWLVMSRYRAAAAASHRDWSAPAVVTAD